MRTIIKAFFSFTAISLLSLSAFYETSAAREIEIQEAVGSARMYSGEEKKARDEALRDAMKKAVEQGVGTVLASETEVENFQVVSDRILKKSKGTIKSYRILREGAVDNGINYEVVISAVVDDDLLNQSMESFRLMQQMTGRKTVFIVYNPNVQGDLPLNPKNGDHFNLIETAVLAINKKFIERRFSILDFERYKKVMLNRETMALANEADFEDAVSELAAENGAQYYVEFTLMVSDKEIGKNKVAQANIKAKLVNYGTGALIDTIEGKGRKKYKKTTSGMIVFENMGSAIKKAANIAGRELVDSLLTRLYEYAEDGAPIFVSIHVGKKSQVRPFLKMINSMKSVTSSKTVSRIGKDITMYVYGIGDTDSWVGELEDAFYANRKFKGYAVIPALTGETLDLNMEEDE
jgi:hypothetical protein